MKKLLLLFVSVLLYSLSFAQDAATIYGYRTYQGAKQHDYIAGPVKFSTSNTTDVKLIENQNSMGKINAGEYLNYKWYAMTTKVGTQGSADSWVEVDMETGERKYIAKATTQLREMAYDYSTQTMYGLIGDEYLAKVDMDTWAVTNLGQFPKGVYVVGLSVDLSGSMYALSINDTLYTVDKTNPASVTTVGFTGVNIAMYQTMAFDHNTGVLYSVNTDGYIYSLNTTTGVATEIGPLGEYEDQLSSMFIPYTNAPKGSPERINNLKVETSDIFGPWYDFKWTFPTVDTQGKPLTTAVGARIYENGELKVTVDADIENIGKEIQRYGSTSAGKHNYKIVCFNDKGEGGFEEFVASVGVPDAPGAVENLEVVSGDETAEFSWDISEFGATFGNDCAPTGFKVARVGVAAITLPADARNYSMPVTPWGTYTFSITAFNEEGDGPIVYSSPVLIKPENWIIMSDGTLETDGGVFYDAGGPSDTYKNSSRITMTLKPKAGKGLKFEFTQFVTEKAYGVLNDYLEVYAGEDKSAPLIGKFGGSGVPEELKALYTNNPITFYFHSDVMSPMAGWTANVSSYEIKDTDIITYKISDPGYSSAKATSEFPVTLQNIGANAVLASSYQVQVLDEQNDVLASVPGEDIAPMETKTIKVPYAPSNKGELKIKGHVELTTDGNQTNNTSDLLSIDVLEEGTFATIIGSKNENNMFGIIPMSFLTTDSYTQIMIPASMINADEGFLTRIIYPYVATNAYNSVDLKIWVSETDKEDLAEGNILASDMQLVFDGKGKILKGNNDLDISLTQFYEYKGNNLLISVLKSGAGTDDMGVLFYWTAMEKTYTVYNNGWDEGYPVDPNKPIHPSSVRQDLPDVILLISDKEPSGVNGVNTDSKIYLYPNPFDDVISIQGATPGSQIVVLDLSGKILQSTTLANDQVNLSDLNSGLYLMKIITKENDVIVRRIVKK